MARLQRLAAVPGGVLWAVAAGTLHRWPQVTVTGPVNTGRLQGEYLIEHVTGRGKRQGHWSHAFNVQRPADLPAVDSWIFGTRYAANEYMKRLSSMSNNPPALAAPKLDRDTDLLLKILEDKGRAAEYLKNYTYPSYITQQSAIANSTATGRTYYSMPVLKSTKGSW